MNLLDALMGGGQSSGPMPLASMIAANPVGTETTQEMRTADRGFQPGVQWGALGLVSPKLYGAAQNAIGNALGWVGTFGGPAAKTADLAKLAQAKELAGSGATRDAIWQHTGWFQGPEGNWRFEIPDNQMQRLALVGQGSGAPLGAIIDHPALFDAYPQLRQTDVVLGGRSGGSFSPAGEGAPATISIGSNQSPFTLLHEIQHNVQSIEGNPRGASTMSVVSAPDLSPHFFAKYNEIAKNVMTPLPYEEYAKQAWGGEMSPESLAAYNEYAANVPKKIPLYSAQDKAIQETAAQDVYKRVSGEVEARANSARYPMTADERVAQPPWQSYDVPEGQMIIRPIDPYANDPIMRALRGARP